MEETTVSMQQQQAAVDAELKRLQGQVDTASDQAQVCAALVTHCTPAPEHGLRKAPDKNGQCMQAVEPLQQQLQDVLTEKEQIQQVHEELQACMNASREQNNELEGKLVAMKAAADTSSDHTAAIDKQVAAMQARIADLENQLAGSERSSTDHAVAVSALQQQIADHVAKARDLEDALDTEHSSVGIHYRNPCPLYM